MKKYIFWEYARGSWQYDVIVGVILAFLFLTPRGWFRDQPRIPQASDISSLPSERGTHQYFVDQEAMAGVPDDQHVATLTRLLQVRSGNPRLTVTHVEPVVDSEGELHGFIVSTRP
ncbi:MAG: hypothetical protein ABSF62_01105 [Bryobacteraceae bacterium]|jgi:hypothetical protein